MSRRKHISKLYPQPNRIIDLFQYFFPPLFSKSKKQHNLSAQQTIFVAARSGEKLIKTIFHQNKGQTRKTQTETTRSLRRTSNNTLDGFLRCCGMGVRMHINGNWLGRNRWWWHVKIACRRRWLRCQWLCCCINDRLEVEHAAETTAARIRTRIARRTWPSRIIKVRTNAAVATSQ